MHYLRLQVVFQNYPHLMKHLFTTETSKIIWLGQESLPLDESTCSRAWEWEQWEYGRVHRDCYMEFDLMMLLHGFCKKNWLNCFIPYYQCLPFTWDRSEVAVTLPMIKPPQELTFPTGVFVPGLQNPPLPLHELVLLIDSGAELSILDPDWDSEAIDSDWE